VIDLLAERTVRGMLCRAAGAWLVVGLLIFAVTLTAYVMLIVRHMRRHSTC
jgi:hypothetical protein